MPLGPECHSYVVLAPILARHADALAVAVYLTTKKTGCCRDVGLVSQIEHAATSTMLNIAYRASRRVGVASVISISVLQRGRARRFDEP